MKELGCHGLFWALLIGAAGPALATEEPAAYFTLAVGYNGTDALPGGEALEPLRFADDDAAAMFRLAREVGHTGVLLAQFDADTRRRLPELAEQARPPTLVELRRAIAELNAAMTAAASKGARTTLLLFYSGHGLSSGAAGPGLALGDGRLTHTRLYEEILPRVKADTVHLIVDACHAEAVVRPRDVRAPSVPTPDQDLRGYLEQHTLARFPQVGAVVASTSTEQTHEWDALRSGVFTHEVLSGLRGAADVDGNRRIEYSELAAFLAAANRNVVDPRARPVTLLRAPIRSPRAPLIELSRPLQAGSLGGRPAPLGPIYVEDVRGNRLCSLHAEAGYRIDLLLPAGLGLFVRGKRGEAEIRLTPHTRRGFDELVWKPQPARPRGAIAESLRQGLFLTRFGPSYYSGFVDRSDDLVSVTIPAMDDESGRAPPEVKHRPSATSYLAWGAAVPLASLAIASGIMAIDAGRDMASARFERSASQAHARYVRYGGLSIGAATAAALAGAVGYWLRGR